MSWFPTLRSRLPYATGLFIALGVTLLFRYFGDVTPSDRRYEWRPASEALMEEPPPIRQGELPTSWKKLGALQTLLMDLGFLFLAGTVAALLPTSLSFPFCLFILASATSMSLYAFDMKGIWSPLPGILVGISLLYVLIVIQRLGRSEKLKWRLQEETEIMKEFDKLKNNFMGLFSHDLKTPLAKIQAITNRLQVSPQAHDLQEDLTEISKAAEELKKYINNILNLVKVESNRVRIQTRPTDLNVLLRNSLNKVVPLASEKQIVFDTQLEPLFSVEVDPHLLTEVFLNILDNAIKYSPSGSTVYIKSWEENSYIHVTIRNEGHGLPQSIRTDLWEKISEDRSGLHGSGIGLYLVKYFVELHGGQVIMDSKPGHGTEVQVMIPLDGG